MFSLNFLCLTGGWASPLFVFHFLLFVKEISSYAYIDIMLINHTENWSGVEILACEDLLVVMEEEESRVQISLWNGRSKTWLTDLDISVAGLTRFSFEPVSICLSMNLMAVFVTEPEYRTFFWQLKTSQPTASSPQFLGSVKLTQD